MFCNKILLFKQAASQFYIKSYCETVNDECSHMIIDHELYGIAVDALRSSDFLFSCNNYDAASFSFIEDDFIPNMLKRSESFFWITRFLSSFCGIEKKPYQCDLKQHFGWDEIAPKR